MVKRTTNLLRHFRSEFIKKKNPQTQILNLLALDTCISCISLSLLLRFNQDKNQETD